MGADRVHVLIGMRRCGRSRPDCRSTAHFKWAIQHLLPKMGHKSLLVTQTLHGLKGWGTADAAASAAPAA
jgi:hypothetical protein